MQDRFSTAYVCHKNGYWAGVSAADMKDIGKWLGSFAKEGFTISTVHTRDEYNALMATLQCWSESPEYKAKHKPKPAPEPQLAL